MFYVLIDRNATDDIIQDRFFQNLGFPPAQSLIKIIRGDGDGPAHLRFTRKDRGLIITSVKNTPSKDFVLFDLASLTIINDHNDAELLTIIQKTLRFAIKYWGALALGSGEKIIKASTKAVIFPFPFVANKVNYRITIEREPNAKRLEKRGAGRFLLVYKNGTSIDDGADEKTTITNFKKGYDDYQEIFDTLSEENTKGKFLTVNGSINVTNLEENIPNQLSAQGLNNWKRFLTDDQRQFVESGWASAHRLEGPAGTGKTLCMILKCLRTLTDAKENGIAHRSVFITPSDELSNTVKFLLSTNGGQNFIEENSYSEKQQFVRIVTLQRLCGEYLNYEISESEFLDRDSVESKNTQLLYFSDIIQHVKEFDVPVIQRHLSAEFFEFIKSEEIWTLAQMLRHEISVIIKGRANGNIDTYKRIPSLKYGLPISSDADKEFSYKLFKDYQKKLEASAQYDVDDIVISTIGQFDTPIWSRRRQRDGFDSILIDEVHLFNMNEISVLHYLSKTDKLIPISYTIDRAQAVGDIGWNEAEFSSIFDGDGTLFSNDMINVNAVFRSAPEIIDLAFAVTSSGASLFTNFHNPLDLTSTTFTADEERKCSKPCYITASDDDGLIQLSFNEIDRIAKEMKISKDKILVIVFGDVLLRNLILNWKTLNRNFKLIERRGDFSTVDSAARSGCVLISPPELVGGLEFDAVLIVGCDKGRLPPENSDSGLGRAFLNYSAHNLLYVAITRAKYRVEILINKNRGLSNVLNNAIAQKLIIEHTPS